MKSGFVFGLLLLHLIVTSNRFGMQAYQDVYVSTEGKKDSKIEGEDEGEREYPTTGSRLPDCSHACGACAPCKRVMVSFKCSSAESCPVVYRCMCHGKYYHVPSHA